MEGIKMEPLRTIGTLLDGTEQRDAIHIAVMPVISADRWIGPGDKLRLVFGTTNQVIKVREGDDEKGIGVADPFLNEEINKGDKFWMFMYPNSITGLRHQWVHPEVDTEMAPLSDPERWIRGFADKWNFDYNELIEQATAEPREWGNYAVAMGQNLHSAGELGEDHDLFWKNLTLLTKQAYSREHIEKFGWSCSC
jgi:hypothetical protein